jgi:hypothetical protein
MPNPTPSLLHVDVPLTNISVGYMQDQSLYVADQVFPKVPVQHQSNLYWKYNKSEWRRTEVQKRAPSTESVGAGWRMSQDSYFAHVYALHKDIDDQLRANADSVFSLNRDATQFVTDQLLLHREIDWVSTYFASGVWDTDLDGVASGPGAGEFLQWDQAGSTPIEEITEQKIMMAEQTGFMPNTLVLGAYVEHALQHHADILDRIKYTQRGQVTREILASLFGVDRILVPMATKNTGPMMQTVAATESNAVYSFTHGKNALLVYAAPSPSLMQPSGGYTFEWVGYAGSNERGLRVKNFRMELIASDRIEGEAAYDMKVVSPDVGTLFSAAVG